MGTFVVFKQGLEVSNFRNDTGFWPGHNDRPVIGVLNERAYVFVPTGMDAYMEIAGGLLKTDTMGAYFHDNRAELPTADSEAKPANVRVLFKGLSPNLETHKSMQIFPSPQAALVLNFDLNAAPENTFPLARLWTTTMPRPRRGFEYPGMDFDFYKTLLESSRT